MKEEKIKRHLRKRYGQIAKQARWKGCGCAPISQKSSCCGSLISLPKEEEESSELAEGQISNVMAEPYTAEEKSAVPDGADLGLGCGVPTRYAQFKSGETVLDLGCGAGVDCFIAAREVGPTGRVIGVDMTPEMIAKAKQNLLQLDLKNVEFYLGEIENLPVDNSVVDIVISNCVINLVPNKPKAFREIYRVLKPNGRMVVSDMMIEGTLPDIIRKDVEAFASCIAGALKVEEFLEYVRNAGLTDVKILQKSPYPWGKGKNCQIVSCVVAARKSNP